MAVLADTPRCPGWGVSEERGFIGDAELTMSQRRLIRVGLRSFERTADLI